MLAVIRLCALSVVINHAASFIIGKDVGRISDWASNFM